MWSALEFDEAIESAGQPSCGGPRAEQYRRRNPRGVAATEDGGFERGTSASLASGNAKRTLTRSHVVISTTSGGERTRTADFYVANVNEPCTEPLTLDLAPHELSVVPATSCWPAPPKRRVGRPRIPPTIPATSNGREATRRTDGRTQPHVRALHASCWTIGHGLLIRRFRVRIPGGAPNVLVTVLQRAHQIDRGKHRPQYTFRYTSLVYRVAMAH